MSNHPQYIQPFLWEEEPRTSPLTPVPEAPEEPVSSAKDFCDCAKWTKYYGIAQTCPKCKLSSPDKIRQHVIDVLESAGVELANSGSIVLSKELFDTIDMIKKRGI